MENSLYTMESTTNAKFKYLEGSTGILTYDETYNIYWFNNFHTSSIRKVIKKKNKITLITLNSVYKFKESK